MAYIGNTVQTQGFTPAIDYFSGNGSTVTFTLSRPVASVAQIICAIDNVIQNPSSAYTVSGSSITFTSAPLSGTNNIWVEYTSLITTYAALSQSPSVVGDITASGGYLAVGNFGASFVDGTIVDYVTGNGRVTVGPADGFTLYTGGTSARTALAAWDSSGNLTNAGSAVIQGLTVGKGGGSQSANTVLGTSALSTNTTGNYSVAVGANALKSSNADANTAVGSSSMFSNTSGTNNVAVGITSLYTNTTGSSNTALGYYALALNTTASANTAVGYTALYSNTTGATNTAVGYQSLYANTTGTLNVAMGDGALSSNTTGGSNTAFGSGCLAAHTTGTNNTAIGRVAGSAITTGTYNTILGSQDSTLTTGSYNTFIGRFANASASSSSYALVINTDNTARTDKGSSTGFIFTGGSMYQGNNSAAWAITSDARLKKNIVDNTIGLDAITQIQVRNFEYRTKNEVTDLPKDQAVEVKGIQLGAIAQEIQAILPECVKTESTGVMSVDTTNLTWYLINAVKELKAEVDSLKQ
jgi:hypothetical protein